MNVKRFLLLALVFVAVVSVSGCKLPASTAPKATPTAGTEFPVPGTETMGLFETIATQTAAAAGGQSVDQTVISVVKPSATNKPGAQQQAAATAPTKTPTPKKSTKKHATATEGVPDTYTLEKGEYPYCIARRFDVNPGELLSRNGLSFDSMTFAGLTLAIPQTGNGFPGSRELRSHPDDYTVKSGDSIYSIACYYGDVYPMAIADENGLDEPYSISTGDKLHIP